MRTKPSSIFSKILDVIEVFDNFADLDQTDSLTGTFQVRRRKNRKGISNVKATFLFKDDIVSGTKFRKVRFKDRITNSLFGDAVNERTSGKGNKKYDYLDNGEKIVELSIEPQFIKRFEVGKNLKGFFRVDLDDNIITMSTGQRDQFKDNKILTADFETNFL